ncbi:hypothetical protein D3C86_1627800 [compost metagenome]
MYLCRAGISGRLPSARNQAYLIGSPAAGLYGSFSVTGRTSIGLAHNSFSRMCSGIWSAIFSNNSSSVGRFSGPTTCGIWPWCSKPSSSYWNDALHVKMVWPFCTAVTRRVLKLPPSRTRST